MQRNPFEQDPQVQRHRRAVRLTLLVGAGLLCLGFSLALNPFDKAEASVPDAPLDLENIEFTSAPTATSPAAEAYLAAQHALAEALGEDDAALRDTATYFSLLESMGPVFLTAERESASALLAALQSRPDQTPLTEARAAYETARLGYIEHLLSQR